MSVLDKISIMVEPCKNSGLTHNTLPLLHEIRHALIRFADKGEPTILDLKAIPFGPGDEEKLLSFLGAGEIQATVDALGETRVIETAYPGVWLVEYKNPEQERIALQIEITDMPAILKTQPDDIRDCIALISTALEENTSEL